MVPENTGMSSMYAILIQRRLRWLGHVCLMDVGKIPKDNLYGELSAGTRPTGRSTLRFKDACKRDLPVCKIDQVDLEAAKSDPTGWWATVKAGAQLAEDRREAQPE